MEPALASEHALDPTAIAVWLERYIGVWNAHDVEGIAALYTEDVAYFDPGHPRVMHGQAEVRGFLRGVFAALPDFAVTPAGPICAAPAAPQALAAYTFSGTMLGDWPDLGLAATAGRMSGTGVSHWTFCGESCAPTPRTTTRSGWSGSSASYRAATVRWTARCGPCNIFRRVRNAD